MARWVFVSVRVGPIELWLHASALAHPKYSRPQDLKTSKERRIMSPVIFSGLTLPDAIIHEALSREH